MSAPTSNRIFRLRLTNTTGGSNKFYEFNIYFNPGAGGDRFAVWGRYGRIDRSTSSGNDAFIGKDSLPIQAAKAFMSKAKEKFRKGYVIDGGIEKFRSPEIASGAELRMIQTLADRVDEFLKSALDEKSTVVRTKTKTVADVERASTDAEEKLEKFVSPAERLNDPTTKKEKKLFTIIESRKKAARWSF